LDVLFTTPFKDDLILAFDDDGNDDYKDCEGQLHVDVGECSQFPDENIPSGDGPLIVEMARNKSMTNQLVIVKAIAKNTNWVVKTTKQLYFTKCMWTPCIMIG